MKMDNDDLDDAEFLKALEESKRQVMNYLFIRFYSSVNQYFTLFG